VTLSDLSKYDDLIEPVLKMKDVELYSTDFDHTDRVKLETKLVAKACDNARREASDLASGFGVELGSLKAVSKQGFHDIGHEFGLGDIDYGGSDFAFADQGFGDTLFLPMTIRLQARVSAIFELGNGK